MLMYEYKSQHPVTSKRFLRRIVVHFLVVMILIVLSLLIGMAGYAYFESLSWRDAFLNASMLLGGMRPVEVPQTDGGKIFAGMYALYSGLVFLVTLGLLFAPVVHRIMHTFHWEQDQ